MGEYVALPVAATPGSTYDVAYETSPCYDGRPFVAHRFGFASGDQRASFLRWASLRAVPGDPADRDDFLRHWDLLGQYAPAELQAFRRIRDTAGNSAAVRAIRQTTPDARESLRVYFALNALYA